MPNAILTPTAVTREALRILHQKSNFIGSVVHDYDDSFAKKGAKIGDTLKIRQPNQYTVRTGATLSAQDTQESSIDLKVTTQKGVDLNFSSVELTLSLDDFSKRILEPAMSVLAAHIEADAQSMFKDVYQSTWNNGAGCTYDQVLDGKVVLNNSLAPTSSRMANLNSRDMADLVKDTKTLFNGQEAISKQYREGYMGRAAGFDFAENTIWPGYTRGAGAGYLVNGAGQSGASLVVGTGTGAVNAGDVFTIAGVFRVHPETKQPTSVLQQFVVTSAHGGGAGALAISPAIVTTGAKQNVSAAPANGAAVTFAGTASTAVGTSMLYQEEAFAFATADLVMPSGVDFASRQVLDGISMRIVRQYDINSDKFPCRLDVLYGYKTLRAELAHRLHNR